MTIINPELFVLEHKKEGEYILYLPKTGSALVVNDATIRLLQKINSNEKYTITKDLEKTLKEHNIINEKFKTFEDKKQINKIGYMPTAVTLLPTWDCQLRCIYCYAHGGEGIRKTMSIDVAKSSIDFIVTNAIITNNNSIKVGFHGGGEPLLAKNIPLLNEILSYASTQAKNNNLKINTGAVTNAVMNNKTIEWVIKNLSTISISWDGLPEIQDIQRPLANGGKSSKYVLNTMKILDEKNFYYSIRSTISNRNVKLMSEIVDFIANNTKVKNIQFEQLFQCGRCEDSKEKPPNETEFINEYFRAQRLAKKYDISITNSCSDSSIIRNTFCGAAGSNFFVTPDGNVTTCLEVTREEDPFNEVFFIGKYDYKQKIFAFNYNRIESLKKRTINNMNGCTNCFAKHACSGDCLAKTLVATGSLYGTSEGNYRCETNRALIKENLYGLLFKNYTEVVK